MVTREVKRLLGSDQFDVEVWNELTFGSKFLGINNYYSPRVEPSNGKNQDAILERTIAYIRDPSHEFPTWGSETASPTSGRGTRARISPAGLTAIDKHPYSGWIAFPRERQVNGTTPLNGLGEPDGWQDESGRWHEDFTPTYDSFFPEYYLSGIQTETLGSRSLPLPLVRLRAEHGRYSHPEGGAPTMWITEANLNPAGGPTPASEMSERDIHHVMAKDILRYSVAYVNKGVTAIHFYAATGGNLSLDGQGLLRRRKRESVDLPRR